MLENREVGRVSIVRMVKRVIWDITSYLLAYLVLIDAGSKDECTGPSRSSPTE